MGPGDLRAGDRAPQLSGGLADGTTFDLASTRARAILIEFHRGTW
jgi:peroxiredoxin